MDRIDRLGLAAGIAAVLLAGALGAAPPPGATASLLVGQKSNTCTSYYVMSGGDGANLPIFQSAACGTTNPQTYSVSGSGSFLLYTRAIGTPTYGGQYMVDAEIYRMVLGSPSSCTGDLPSVNFTDNCTYNDPPDYGPVNYLCASDTPSACLFTGGQAAWSKTIIYTVYDPMTLSYGGTNFLTSNSATCPP